MMRLSRVHIPDATKREDILVRLERITELPLLVLAFIMIPLILGPFLWDLSAKEEVVFATIDSLIWALFAVDLGVKVAVAPHRFNYLRRHWLEIIIVALPFLRPLRLLRLFMFGTRAFVGVRRLVHLDFLLVYGIGLVIICATVVATLESGAEKASITSFPDALWWAMATVTTVGYGDEVPVTIGGRSVAFVLMLGGIAFYGGVTANMASLLVTHKSDAQQLALAQMTGEIESLKNEIARLQSERT